MEMVRHQTDVQFVVEPTSRPALGNGRVQKMAEKQAVAVDDEGGPFGEM